MEFFGLPPKNMIINSPKKYLFFDKNLNPLEKMNSFGKIRKPNTKSISKRLKKADKDFIKFVKECLKWDRKERLSPLKALRHEWIVKDLGKEMLDVHNNKIEEILNNNE
jgi:dual specificity tyrosine-phosphorylation-regulated kinase 2/3/4